jgi:menaquinone-specific isochorismate synthase
MTVSPCLPGFFVHSQEIYQFFLGVQEKCISHNCTQIASISLEIDYVDPLIILDQLAHPNQLSFYWENQSQKEAITAIDAVAKLELSGNSRFTDAETFIKDCQDNIIHFRSTTHDSKKPYFFCSFSFFDENLETNYPFPNTTIFLPRWQIIAKDQCYFLIANTVIHAGVNIQKILDDLWQQVEIIKSLKNYVPDTQILKPNFQHELVTKPEVFKNSILSALKSIHTNQLRKIVLANALDISTTTPINLFHSLKNLRCNYPNCYTFSTSNGKGQNFIGASPERLITINNHHLLADALAGSAPRGKNPTEDTKNANRLLNSNKERREHSLVLDFIIQRLTSLDMFPQVMSPRLRQLSNIQHLWTPIQAIVPSHIHPLKIVSQLHPTPAVAGVSRDIACTEIRRYENFERGLYAAPLGWVDTDGNCEFIVGIRSALVEWGTNPAETTKRHRARLYAGAGIVAGSDPKRELAEIQLKFQALLNALV